MKRTYFRKHKRLFELLRIGCGIAGLIVIALLSYAIVKTQIDKRNGNSNSGKTASSSNGVVGKFKNVSLSNFSISDLLKYTNDNRIKASLAPLELNTKLNTSAKTKCDDMVVKNYWSHDTPEGLEPWVFIRNAGYTYNKAGENLSYGFRTSEDVVAGWMNSPEHRANILNTGFKEVGFGICESKNYMNSGPESVIVQHFGTPYTPSATATPAPKAPTPVYKPYVAPVCTKTPIPYKTTTTEVSYLYVGETQSYGGTDGYTETCTADSTGYKPPDFTIPPYDKTTYVGTKVR